MQHETNNYVKQTRVQTIRLMLEEEQRYVDSLRSELARGSADEKKFAELTNAERNVATLQSQLQAILSGQNEVNISCCLIFVSVMLGPKVLMQRQ